jgi:hypothetical protein
MPFQGIAWLALPSFILRLTLWVPNILKIGRHFPDFYRTVKNDNISEGSFLSIFQTSKSDKKLSEN